MIQSMEQRKATILEGYQLSRPQRVESNIGLNSLSGQNVLAKETVLQSSQNDKFLADIDDESLLEKSGVILGEIVGPIEMSSETNSFRSKDDLNATESDDLNTTADSFDERNWTAQDIDWTKIQMPNRNNIGKGRPRGSSKNAIGLPCNKTTNLATLTARNGETSRQLDKESLG